MVTGKDIGKSAITVGATLGKWGIQGAGMVFRGGVNVALASMNMSTDLAKTFSGDSIGAPIGSTMAKGSGKILKSGISAAENACVNAVNWAAQKGKNALS